MSKWTRREQDARGLFFAFMHSISRMNAIGPMGGATPAVRAGRPPHGRRAHRRIWVAAWPEPGLNEPGGVRPVVGRVGWVLGAEGGRQPLGGEVGPIEGRSGGGGPGPAD